MSIGEPEFSYSTTDYHQTEDEFQTDGIVSISAEIDVIGDLYSSDENLSSEGQPHMCYCQLPGQVIVLAKAWDASNRSNLT